MGNCTATMSSLKPGSEIFSAFSSPGMLLVLSSHSKSSESDFSL